ncbi:MAG: hypothetical protein IPM98_08895 [Lewinellaceae bacterium]|nr:hypothetical protein [Lewinellaceae bacterium]
MDRRTPCGQIALGDSATAGAERGWVTLLDILERVPYCAVDSEFILTGIFGDGVASFIL